MRSSVRLRAALLALSTSLFEGACSNPPPSQPTQCCTQGLIDESLLIKPNGPGTGPHARILPVPYETQRSFNLEKILLPGISGNAVKWTVDGIALTNATLLYEESAGPEHVFIHSVGVSRKSEGGRDDFRAVIIPSASGALFQHWLETETGDVHWTYLLPPVYSSLTPELGDPEPANCSRDYWGPVNKLDSNYYPGGAYEMLSKAVADGSGHQAIYDAKGNLIREGLGSGSADRATPRLWGWGFLKHKDADLRPFVWAAQLDGNPANPEWMFRDLDAAPVFWGPHLQRYATVRPTLVFSSGEIKAGTCIAP